MTALLIHVIMIYDFSIAGLLLRCDVPFEMYMSDETAPFYLAEGGNDPDFLFTMTGVSEIAGPGASAVRYQNYDFAYSDSSVDIYHYRDLKAPPVVHVSWQKAFPDRLCCRYLQKIQDSVCTGRDIINLINLELFLLHFGGLLLHCSYISRQGKGILFTAPSGTGKSTQADLWKQYEQADIINGDRAALVRRDGEWSAWGLPYAGTSGIYRNTSAPVSAIVVLRQASENRTVRLSPAQALRYIYPELTMHRWDHRFVDKALSQLLEFLTDVPVWLLECTPDYRAVRCLKETLTEGGILS